MNAGVRISVQNLTKVFALRKRRKVKGISTDTAGALLYLLKQTLQPGARDAVPERGAKGSLFALDGISFEVPAGEVLGIIGRNGAGKTTLLKILARVLDPTAGRVTIRGRVASLLELGIGFAPTMTVRENIQIYGRLGGIPAKHIRAAEDRILDFAGLGEYPDVALEACPSGSFVRLAFSAMMHLDTDIVLADEVLAVGDTAYRHACEERIRAVSQSGESVLFVSHDMNAIRRCCTRVIWIDRGRICQVGPTEQVVKAYTSELLAGRLLPAPTDDLTAGCRLLDLRLLDAERAPVGALQMTEPGYVDCLLRIERPDVAVTPQIELWRPKKVHVLTCTTQRPITAREPTTFRAGVRLPANFLNEPSYLVRCRLYVEDITDQGAPPRVAAEAEIELTVMNPHPDESVWADWMWDRSGAVAPRLPWTNKLLGPTAAP